MQLHVGDRVRFLNATGGGVVSWILDEDQVMVTDESGFDFPTPVSQCVLVAAANETEEVVQVTSYRTPRQKVEDAMRPTKTVENLRDVLEVDLHLDHVVGKTSLAAYQQAVEVQMEHFRKVLSEHRLHKGKRIIFIHGKGEGILRDRIREELAKRHPSYLVSDASFQRYGMGGATEVIIK